MSAMATCQPLLTRSTDRAVPMPDLMKSVEGMRCEASIKLTEAPVTIATRFEIMTIAVMRCFRFFLSVRGVGAQIPQ